MITKPRVAWAVLLVAVVLLCREHVRGYVAQLPPFHADEAGHALAGARVALAIDAGDPVAAVKHIVSDPFWPFVHAVWLSPFLLFGGLSVGVARLSSVVAYGASLVVLYAIAQRISKGARSSDIGIVALALCVCTPSLWMFAGSVMLESLGTLMTHVAVLLLLELEAHSQVTTLRACVCGLACAAVFLTKYNYGIPVIVTALAAAVSAPVGHLSRAAKGGLIASSIIPCVAWLFCPFPFRLLWTFDFLKNRDEGLRGSADWGFYPLWVTSEMGVAIAAGVGVGLISFVMRCRSRRVWIAAAPALLTVLMMTLHPNKQNRYILTALPLLYLAAELGLRDAVSRWRKVSSGMWLVLSGVVLLLGDPRGALAADLNVRREQHLARALFDFAEQHVPRGSRTLFAGGGPLLPHLLLEWRFASSWREQRPSVLILPYPEEGVDGHAGLPTALTPAYGDRLNKALTRDVDIVVAMECDANSPLCPEWLSRFDGWRNNYAVAMRSTPGWHAVAAQRDDAARVTVTIYERSVPSNGRRPEGP